MPNNFVGNHSKKLLEHINLNLASTEKARFRVRYFFRSGFPSIVEEFNSIKELRLFISNTTNRKTQA